MPDIVPPEAADRAAILERAATLLAHDEDLPFDPVVPPT